MPRKINIAIDGHSSCGKGTLAKNLAKALGYTFIDSGAMYRAVALYLMEKGISIEEVQANPALLNEAQIDFQYDESAGYFHTFLNGQNVESIIRTDKISSEVGRYSTVREIREYLVAKQQEIGREKGVVMGGRDIGTIVFPDAELKIFMTAEPRVRAKRRFLELKQQGLPVSFEEIYEAIRLKDDFDANRPISPLVQAPDAIELNNTEMTKHEQAQIALTWARGVIMDV